MIVKCKHFRSHLTILDILCVLFDGKCLNENA